MIRIKTTKVKIPIEPRDSNGAHVSSGNLKLEVSGPQTVKGSIVSEGEKVFAIFETETTGPYTLTVMAPNGKPTVGTPVTVNVREQKEGEQPTIGDKPLVRRHPIRFACEPRAQNGELLESLAGLSATVHGPEFEDVKLELTNGELVCSFVTPILSAEYKVDIKHNGTPIFRSPFALNLAGKKAPGGDNTARVPGYKQPVSFEVEARLDNGSREVNVADVKCVVQPANLASDVTVTAGSPGKIKVSFNVVAAATFTVELSVNGMEFEKSPVTVDLKPK